MSVSLRNWSGLGNLWNNLIEFRLCHTISMNQATVNQSIALPVVSQLSIRFDLRDVGLCASHIHEMISWEHRERTKWNYQRRKLWGTQAGEIRDNLYVMSLPFVNTGKTPSLVLYLMVSSVTLWTASAWDSWWM